MARMSCSHFFVAWLVHTPLCVLLLCWCTSCSGKRQSRAETSAPPEVSSFCVNPCNLWEKILSQKFCEFSVFCGRHFAAAEARIPPLLSSAA